MQIDWLEVTVPATAETEEALGNFLFELGCTGCQMEGAKIRAYFPGKIAAAPLRRKIQAYLTDLQSLGLPAATGGISSRRIADRDWNAEWKKTLAPMQVSEKFVVKPSWCEYTPAAGILVLEIDPQQAFGTGSHATTRMMLRLLEKYARPGMRLLDVGTGSGILAIAGGRLGLRRIVALDNDPLAVSTARVNIARNFPASDIMLFAGELCSLRQARFDLILANLNKTVIYSLLPEMERLAAESGFLLLSGILADELADLKGKLEAETNWATVEIIGEEEWVALVLHRRKL